MRKCINCNITVPDSEKFCQNCGMATVPAEEPAEAVKEPLQQAQEQVQAEAPQPYVNTAAVQPKPKKKKTGLIIGIIAALAALIAIGVFVGVKLIKNKPIARFYEAQTRFMNMEGGKAGELEKFLRGEAEIKTREISTDASLRVDVPGLIDFDGYDILGEIELGLNIDTASNRYGVQANYKGSPLVTGVVGIEGDDILFYLPELDDEYYVVSKNILLADTELEADEKLVFETVPSVADAYEAVKDRYLAIIKQGFAEEDFTAEKQDASLEGFDTAFPNAQVITYKPNQERVAAMLKALGAELKADEALSNYVLSLMEHYYGRRMLDLTVPGLLESKGADASRGIMPLLEDYGEQLEEEAENWAKELVENEFTWKIAVDGGRTVAQYITCKDSRLAVEVPEANKIYIRALMPQNDLDYTIYSSYEDDHGDITVESKVDEETVRISANVTDIDASRENAFGMPYFKCTGSIESSSFTANFSYANGAGENGGSKLSFNLTDIKIEGADDDDNLPERLGFELTTTDEASTLRMPEDEPTRLNNEDELYDVIETMETGLQMVLFRLIMGLQFGTD